MHVEAPSIEKLSAASFKEILSLRSALFELSRYSELTASLVSRLDSCWKYFSSLNRGFSPEPPKILESILQSNPGMQELSEQEMREIIYEKIEDGVLEKISALGAAVTALCDSLRKEPNCGKYRSSLEAISIWSSTLSDIALRDASSYLKRADGFLESIRAVIAEQPSPAKSLNGSGHSKKFIDPETKKAIRVQILNAFAEEVSEDDIRQLRQNLADAHDLTVIQVGSIGAWLTITAEKILDSHNLLGRLTARNLAFAYKYVTLWNTQDERAIAFSEVASQFDVDVDSLLRVVSEYEVKIDFGERLITEAPLLVEESIRRPLPAPVVEIEEPIHETSNESGGAFVDYDNPVKLLWRAQWFDFIDRNYPIEKRSEAKILCLPSINPEREVAGYLKLGFLPGNIIGVEREKRAAGLFSERAEALGIVPVIGDLKQILPTMKTRLDIVSLDFLGPLSPTVTQIFNNVPLNEDALVLANVMGRREQQIVQDTLKGIAEERHQGSTIPEDDELKNRLFRTMSDSSGDPKVQKEMAKILEKYKISHPSDLKKGTRDMRSLFKELLQIPGFETSKSICDELEAKQNYEETRTLPELRDSEYINFVIGALGLARCDLLGYRPISLRNDVKLNTGCCEESWGKMHLMGRIDHIRSASSVIDDVLGAVLFSYFKLPERYTFPRYSPSNVLYVGSALISKLIDAQIVKYTSPVSFAKTPYHTVHLHVQNPVDLRKSILPAYKFLEKFAIEIIRLPEEKRIVDTPFHIFVSNEEPTYRFARWSTPGGKLRGDQWVTVVDKEGDIVATVQARDLLNGLQRIHEYLVRMGNNTDVVDRSQVINLK